MIPQQQVQSKNSHCTQPCDQIWDTDAATYENTMASA